MTAAAPIKNAPQAKPQKRPAQPSSQDAGMHPPKKQRIDTGTAKGKGAATVAKTGAGARAAGSKGAGKGKVTEKGTSAKGGEKQGEKRPDRMIATAHAVTEKAAPVQTTTSTTTKQTDNVTKATEAVKDVTTANIPTKTIPPPDQNTTKPTTSHVDNPSGPSKPNQTTDNPKKTKSKHKSTNKAAPNVDAKLKTARRMPPVKPLTADAQNALGRPKKASGSNPTRAIEGRDVVFVTRKTSLGSYMRRCKTLLVEDGLNQITLHALCVAIPHAVMLLYALTDILPFPRQFIHHEIQTSSVECHDEMSLVAAELMELTKGGLAKSDKEKGKDKALAIFEEDEAGIRSRTKSGIRITVRIGKGARVTTAEHENPSAKNTGAKKARPNKVQRIAKRAQEDCDGDADMGEPVETVEEEERMNEDPVEPTKADAPKQQAKTALTNSPQKDAEKSGGASAGAKKQKKGGAKQKPRTSAVAMDVD